MWDYVGFSNPLELWSESYATESKLMLTSLSCLGVNNVHQRHNSIRLAVDLRKENYSIGQHDDPLIWVNAIIFHQPELKNLAAIW
jgi:hypothetical protein